jgi:hypothetical protein
VRTVVIPPPGVHGFGRSRTVGVVARRLDGIQGFLLVQALADEGIKLRVYADEKAIHLHPVGPVTTAQEVRALRAFCAVTDVRVQWHEAVA